MTLPLRLVSDESSLLAAAVEVAQLDEEGVSRRIPAGRGLRSSSAEERGGRQPTRVPSGAPQARV